MRHDPASARRVERTLRELLNEWDPIGVFDADGSEGDAPLDEYDCIRGPLISRLLRGDSREMVGGFLRKELADHFGLEPRLVTEDVINKIFEFWESVG